MEIKKIYVTEIRSAFWYVDVDRYNPSKWVRLTCLVNTKVHGEQVLILTIARSDDTVIHANDYVEDCAVLLDLGKSGAALHTIHSFTPSVARDNYNLGRKFEVYVDVWDKLSNDISIDQKVIDKFKQQVN